MTDVLVVGESLVDIVQRADGTSVEYAGGSAANVAVALARLGRPVQFVTAYAADARGAVLARHLNQSAVARGGVTHHDRGGHRCSLRARAQAPVG